MSEPSINSYLPFFQMLFEHSTDIVVITDHLARAIYFNPAALKTIGVPAEKLLNRTLMENVGNDASHQPHFDAINAAIKTGQPQSAMTFSKHSQFTRPLYDFMTLTPIFDPVSDGDRQVIGVLEIIREGQQEKDLEAREIIQRERYLSTLLNTIPFMIWMKDHKNRFIVVSDTFAKVLGKANAREFEGKTDLDFLPETLAYASISDDFSVMQSAQPMAISEFIVTKSGNSFWAETYKTPVLLKNEVVGTVGFSRDISAIKQLQSEVAKRQSDYIQLMQSLPLAIIRYDLACRSTFINAYYETLSAHPNGSALGKTPGEFWLPYIHNMTAQEFEGHLREVMATGIAQTLELCGLINDIATVFAMKIVPEFDTRHAVSGVLSIASDITQISQYRQQLEHLAYHDPLTDLPNRSLFNDRLQTAVATAERGGQQFGLLIIYLDNFKSVNDSMGHAVGDELLVEAARRLLGSVGTDDTLARLGGDEFALLVTDNTNVDDLDRVAAEIVQLMARPFSIAEVEYFITASVGIARYPSDSKDIGDLMKYADSAMYSAKNKGRNSYQFYTSELTAYVTERLLMETGLRNALQRNELEIHYQPCISLNSRKVTGAEALLRWNSKELGSVAPDKFIPIAEETGLIVQIGAWVLLNAFTTAARLNAGRQEPLVMAINMSSRQFVQSDICASIEHSLQLSGCKPEWIVLELTESLLLQDNAQLQATLFSLRRLGLGISIDDFGTGYSALGYLHKFPISQLKIDRSFVRDISIDEDAAILVKAIIAMASSLNKELVAEGIETQHQSQLLTDWGCKLGQGYLFGKALPLKEFESLLRVSVA